MKIRRKFIQLTNYTYPYGTEGFIKNHLPDGVQGDGMGNYFYLIGENPSTMFTCHLDTASSKQEKVTHIQDSRYIRTNGKTILGADDKAGMIVLLYMIEKNIPGLYYFFIGEEVGCIGSTRVANSWFDNEFSKTIDKVVSFDRRGTTSVITHQFYERCCSSEFANELSTRLSNNQIRLSPDNTGILTDSASFMCLVSECTNISVGYSKEHTFNESQDMFFLQALCESVVKINWKTLPVARDPYSSDFNEYGEEDDDYEDDYIDDLEWTKNYFSYFKCGKEVKKMYISKSKIKEEKQIISQWIFDYGLSELVDKKLGSNNNTSIEWNGNTLSIENESLRMETIATRMEIMKKIPEIAGVGISHLRYDPEVELNPLEF